MATGVEVDLAGGAARGVKAVEVDQLRVVDEEECPIVGNHAELVVVGGLNPKRAVVIDVEEVGAWSHARDTGGIGEELAGDIERGCVERAMGPWGGGGGNGGE